MIKALPVAATITLAVLAAWAVYHFGVAFIAGGSSQHLGLTSDTSSNTGSAPVATLGFSFLESPRDLPQIQFTDGEGRALSLRDFRGRPILLNIWATWSVACRQEM